MPMPHKHLLVFVCCALFYPASGMAGENDFLIIPGERAGFITAHTDYETLSRLLPEHGYRAVAVSLSEGMYRCGTAIYPDTPNEMRIVWKSDTEVIWETLNTPKEKIDAECAQKTAFRQPEYVEVGGVGASGQSLWHTKENLRLGLGIAEVERINGKPFEIMICDCDVAGNAIRGWADGRLPYALTVRFSYNYRAREVENLPRREKGGTPSSLPAMRRMGAVVDSMRAEFSVQL